MEKALVSLLTVLVVFIAALGYQVEGSYRKEARRHSRSIRMKSTEAPFLESSLITRKEVNKLLAAQEKKFEQKLREHFESCKKDVTTRTGAFECNDPREVEGDNAMVKKHTIFVIGEKGERGEMGRPGPTGKRGPKGSSEIDSAPETVRCRDLTEYVKGEKGEAGYQGMPGMDGMPGIKGEPGYGGMPGMDGMPGPKGEPGFQIMNSQKGKDTKRAKGDKGEKGRTNRKE